MVFVVEPLECMWWFLVFSLAGMRCLLMLLFQRVLEDARERRISPVYWVNESLNSVLSWFLTVRLFRTPRGVDWRAPTVPPRAGWRPRRFPPYRAWGESAARPSGAPDPRPSSGAGTRRNTRRAARPAPRARPGARGSPGSRAGPGAPALKRSWYSGPSGSCPTESARLWAARCPCPWTNRACARPRRARSADAPRPVHPSRGGTVLQWVRVVAERSLNTCARVCVCVWGRERERVHFSP